MATTAKTSLENISYNSSNFSMRQNYQVTELVGTAFKLRQRIRNSPSCAHVLVFTKSWMWSFRNVPKFITYPVKLPDLPNYLRKTFCRSTFEMRVFKAILADYQHSFWVDKNRYPVLGRKWVCEVEGFGYIKSHLLTKLLGFSCFFRGSDNWMPYHPS